MRPVTKDLLTFLAGFVLVLLVSAFLAPWVHTFLPFKFDRILRRLIMVGCILLVLGLIRTRRQSLGRLGLEWHPSQSARLVGIGLLIGIFLVTAITGIQWAWGARFWQLDSTDLGRWTGLFLKALGAGMLIGLIEEFFFRGFLFLTLKDLWNTKGSLVVTNLIYAFVHFFPKNRPFVGPEPRVWDSFRILGSMVPDLGRTEILGAFLGLFLFGLLLSLVFLRTGSLFLPIGIHGGCVFALKMSRRFVPEVSEKMGMWSGSKNLYDGIAGWVVLALLNLIAIGISRNRSKGFIGQGGIS